MNFDSPAQEATYNRVKPMLQELFGESCAIDPDNPVFFIRFGSAGCLIQIFPFRDTDTIVNASSQVVTDVEYTAELGRFLLEQNAKLYCGAFAYIEGSILFIYGILGSTCDKAELRNLALFVGSVADDYDDQLVARFGGKRASDA